MFKMLLPRFLNHVQFCAPKMYICGLVYEGSSVQPDCDDEEESEEPVEKRRGDSSHVRDEGEVDNST